MSEQNSPFNSPLPTPASASTTTAPSAEPVMSTPETLSGIFFEPGRTFESLRVRPRFIVAAILVLIAFMAYYVMFIQRVGHDTIAEAQIKARNPDITEEQMAQAMSIQSKPFVRAIGYVTIPIFIAVVFAAGAGLYLLGTMAMAKSMTYKQALAVWVYSSLPPMLIFAVLNVVLLFIIKDVDPTVGNTGLARANLGLLVSAKEQPVLSTVLSSIDVIAFYGLFLGALGLQKVARLSTGAAWGIVLTIWVLGVVIRAAMAAAFGTAS